MNPSKPILETAIQKLKCKIFNEIGYLESLKFEHADLMRRYYEANSYVKEKGLINDIGLKSTAVKNSEKIVARYQKDLAQMLDRFEKLT